MSLNYCFAKVSGVRSCADVCVGWPVLVRNKKRSHSTAVGASLMSNKKVSSLVNKVHGLSSMLVPGCMLHLLFLLTVSGILNVSL